MKITVNSREFADLVLIFLYDKMINEDTILPDYDRFNEISETLKNKGMRSILMHYYLGLDSQMRLKYKRIKESFEDKYKNSFITINNIGLEDK